MEQEAAPDARETLVKLESRLRQLERELAGLAQAPADAPAGPAQEGLEDVRASLAALRAALDDVSGTAERLRAALREDPPPG